MRRLHAVPGGVLGLAGLGILAVILALVLSVLRDRQTPAVLRSPFESSTLPERSAAAPSPTSVPMDRAAHSPLQTPSLPTPTPTAQPDFLSMAWDVSISPDGSRLLFISRRTPQEEWVIYAMSLKTGDIEPFPAHLDAAPKRVDWSPSGRQVAIATWFRPEPGSSNFQDIYVSNADGTGLRHLTSDLGQGIDDLAWSPDGPKVACIVEPEDRADADNLWVCYVDDPHCVRFEVRAYAVSGGAMGYMAWSPDSRRRRPQRG